MTSDLGALDAFVLPTCDTLPFLAFPDPLMPLLDSPETPFDPSPCCWPSTPSGDGLDPTLLADTGGGEDPGGCRLL